LLTETLTPQSIYGDVRCWRIDLQSRQEGILLDNPSKWNYMRERWKQ
jgi:hypothetical protein